MGILSMASVQVTTISHRGSFDVNVPDHQPTSYLVHYLFRSCVTIHDSSCDIIMTYL
jgi:hypothetical protein